MASRKTKKRAHVSDSDHNSGDDAEDFNGVSVSFPPFSGEFESWDAFHEELKRYQEETHQLYKIRSTNSVPDRNKKCGSPSTWPPTTTTSVKTSTIHTEKPSKLLLQARNVSCSKKKKILRYLKEVSGKVVLPKDVENLITKMRKETYTSEDDNVRVAQVLQDFSEGPGNAVDVFRDKSTGLTTCITFQTAHMRRMVGKFPEAVCVDSTYGTNINRYRLFSFMITDKFGCGAFAQHSLVDGESRLNIECADFTELALLRDEFPCATIILCHFHVIDYLQREVSKKDYGFSSFEKMHVKNTLTLMVRAENESLFDDYLSALRKLCAS
ncbi:hypothetical protein PPTG_11130 [Phytophthora nicotianae INRA-310]|uniref:ZSWIM1/3 RNaseH-like domain-containing protein n=1 Tax=Phytophthora nicotianae (strain INRA-310) TaxID=761204 RepID=W2Q885_PHYN3|nr:hypothetical protein PPTG_11130 [Phytophthora nicotianae INRA-310]ETN09081.1 hypothetical protein PPTG_11130 [Phytophthora nicotianae INRA-310]